MGEGHLSVVLATYNEVEAIAPMIQQLLSQLDREGGPSLEVIVVDDDSPDGTADVVRQLGRQDPRVHLLLRCDRSGLASAIRDGLLSASGELAVVMDADGQHDSTVIHAAVALLEQQGLDLVVGSRFHGNARGGGRITGLSAKRQSGSERANWLAQRSLPIYGRLNDLMSGFMVLRLATTRAAIRQVNLAGFKFLYELLSVSEGKFKVGEIPLNFRPRQMGNSKLDQAIVWDWLVSLLHTFTGRIMPRRAVSFALVGMAGMVIHAGIFFILRTMGWSFLCSQIVAVVVAASSNYLVNNILTFRASRLRGMALLIGLLKFLVVCSLGLIANIGVSTAVYANMREESLGIVAVFAGIVVDFIWKYAASSRLVWNVPY
ncbi:glycosyltransferase [Candidatus Synechococcus spongiarum]|uniref:Glycosyl transferase n=1 Tax=Candidatus Synechococcus spongiarum LMB bulk15N TaxID=1943583 RepID=A0A1T1D316_9SYNE|nr:glycosyltransferase [Candidatus Synechococcus spongiarum]MCY4360451.1 glycosyltransferase [Cyanobacteria bacterium MAG APA_bin_95]OOV35232.1 glycosyl transferase [Candidatus Synechococcus spongiarum LMB bulk15N]